MLREVCVQLSWAAPREWLSSFKTATGGPPNYFCNLCLSGLCYNNPTGLCHNYPTPHLTHPRPTLPPSPTPKQAVERATGQLEVARCSAAILVPPAAPAADALPAGGAQEQEPAGAARGLKEGSGSEGRDEGAPGAPVLYNPTALQLWLLKCCQAVSGAKGAALQGRAVAQQHCTAGHIAAIAGQRDAPAGACSVPAPSVWLQLLEAMPMRPSSPSSPHTHHTPTQISTHAMLYCLYPQFLPL